MNHDDTPVQDTAEFNDVLSDEALDRTASTATCISFYCRG